MLTSTSHDVKFHCGDALHDPLDPSAMESHFNQYFFEEVPLNPIISLIEIQFDSHIHSFASSVDFHKMKGLMHHDNVVLYEPPRHEGGLIGRDKLAQN